MPVESTSFSPNPGCVCVRVNVCVCCTHLFSFFTLAFVLVNDLSLVSCFGNAYDFVFVFVAVCFFLLYALVFYVYCRVIPDVLSLMFFHVPPLGFLK